jgi:hypothetical protein
MEPMGSGFFRVFPLDIQYWLHCATDAGQPTSMGLVPDSFRTVLPIMGAAIRFIVGNNDINGLCSGSISKKMRHRR